MRKVLVFSLLLLAGLVGSQALPALGTAAPPAALAVRLLTMVCLAFIMIHVGYEFEIDRSSLRSYAVDSGVAATAAILPWLFCALYFIYVMTPRAEWGSFETWSRSLLAGLFAAPTSAGILFSMLAAAGLSSSWMFRKARVLAIFDDLDTVLLMIPLKMLIVGARWQLVAVVLVMGALLWLAWNRLHQIRLPVAWPWVLAYAAVIAAASELIYAGSKLINDVVPIHIEVLLPAFVLGCILARPEDSDPHRDDPREGHQEGPEDPSEQRVSSVISGVFMVLVGLSMPAIAVGDGGQGGPDWRRVAMHVLAITLLSNLGKMVPLFCYRREAHWRERLALCIGMWPRGEVGAGVLVVALSYNFGGDLVLVAALSLALNLICTGLFIVAARALLRGVPTPQ